MFSIRSRVLVAALVAGAVVEVVPMTAEAQFAGVPRGPRRRSATAVASAGDSVRRDTLPPTRLPDMKAWVDSATVALGAVGGGGSAPAGPPVPAPTAPGTSAPRSRSADSTMRDGARAPDTATPLPSLALAGALLVGAGLIVRRRAAARG